MWTLAALFTVVMLSCQSADKHQEQADLNPGLAGEWWLDSSSSRYRFKDRLIILPDSSVYLFSGTNGDGLISKGKFFNDSLFLDWENRRLTFLDSNRIRLNGGFSNTDDFFVRTTYGDYRGNLAEYLQQDSLRDKVIGWWKLVSSKAPVELINYSGYYKTFTLNIRGDGDAVFYLENKYDSTVNYSYRMNPDGMDFNRGCIVGSDSKISFDDKGRMRLLLDPRMGDTLVLERLVDIK